MKALNGIYFDLFFAQSTKCGWPFNSFISSIFSSEWENWLKWRELTAFAAPLRIMNEMKFHSMEQRWFDGWAAFSLLAEWVGYGRCSANGSAQESKRKEKKAAKFNQTAPQEKKGNERRESNASGSQLTEEVDGADCFALLEWSTKQPRCAASQRKRPKWAAFMERANWLISCGGLLAGRRPKANTNQFHWFAALRHQASNAINHSISLIIKEIEFVDWLGLAGCAILPFNAWFWWPEAPAILPTNQPSHSNI